MGEGKRVTAGMVLVRQRGTPIHAGKHVKVGRDHTLFAATAGVVKFKQKKRRRFDGSLKQATFANIVPTQ